MLDGTKSLILKRAHEFDLRDIWWGNPKRGWDIEDKNMLKRSQSSWTATLLATQSRVRARRDWWLTSVNHTVKSGSTLQSLPALSVGEAEYYAVVKASQVGLALRSKYQDLGIPMKIEIQSDSSTANPLTDRLGAGQRTKHIDTRYFWIQERVQDGDLSIKKGAHGEELRRC